MTNSTTQKSSAAQRLALVDALRGIAVVAMVYIHVVHAFIDWAQAPHAFVKASEFFGGWAAPLFLFLAGLSAAWVALKSSASKVAKRGAEIWLWAIAFRVQEWALGGPGAPLSDIFRIDVLNCLGLSIIIAAGAASLFRRRPLVLVALGLGIFALTPIIHNAAWLSALPWPLAGYLGGPADRAPFPLFGWLGFAFFGAFLGVRTHQERDSRQLLYAAGWGLGLYIPLHLFRLWQPHLVGFEVTDFDFYFLLERQCLALALFFVAALARPLYRWLLLLGRHSLIVYWVHVELAYGMLFYHWHQKLGVFATLAAVGGMLLAMTLLALASDRLLQVRARLPAGKLSTASKPLPVSQKKEATGA